MENWPLNSPVDVLRGVTQLEVQNVRSMNPFVRGEDGSMVLRVVVRHCAPAQRSYPFSVPHFVFLSGRPSIGCAVLNLDQRRLTSSIIAFVLHSCCIRERDIRGVFLLVEICCLGLQQPIAVRRQETPPRLAVCDEKRRGRWKGGKVEGRQGETLGEIHANCLLILTRWCVSSGR